MTRPAAAVAGLVASAIVVGLCMVATPLPGHPAGWLLPAAVAIALGLAGISAAVIWRAYRHDRLTRQLRVIAHPAVLGGLEVEELAGVQGAFVAGLRRPSIFCSPDLSSELEPDELHAVLLHERYHQLDRAPAKRVVLEAVTPALTAIRVGRAWVASQMAALEIAADRYALAHGSSRGALARALLKLAPQPDMVGIGFASATDLRLKALLEEHPQPKAELAVGWLLAPTIVAVLCVMLVLAW